MSSHDHPYCPKPKCKKFFYGHDPKKPLPRHQLIDHKTLEKTGVWCDGAGQLPKVHTAPPAPVQNCLVCKEPIPFGEPCYAVKPCSHIVDFGHGRATYVLDAGEGRIAGGIHKTCVEVKA